MKKVNKKTQQKPSSYKIYLNTFRVDGILQRSTGPLESRAIAKAPEGEGCPRCGGYVYAAEQMLARGRVSVNYT